MADYSIQEWMNAGDKPLVVQSKTKHQYSDHEQSIAKFFSEAIQEEKITLSLLVQNLSFYLNDDENLIGVSRALELFLAIIDSIQRISEDDFNFFIDYLVARLKNEENKSSHNAGLHEVILLFKNFPKLTCFNSHFSSMVIEGIFSLADERLRFKDLPDAVRLDAYTVVDNYLRSYSQDLAKGLGYSYIVTGFVELVNFEKKASCLLIVFTLISYISNKWDVSISDLENLFNSFIRYFPIKISGLQNEALRLSKEMSNCLTECIVSNNFYASLAFPHFIHKIDDRQTVSVTSVHDILMAIDACVKKYSPKTVAQWSSKIWDAIKFELWNEENEDQTKDSLQILGSAVTSLERQDSSDQTPGKSHSTNFIVEIVTQCRDRFVDSPQKYLPSTGRIVYSIASASSNASQLVAKMILPSLIALWQDMTDRQKKKMILAVIGCILKAFVERLVPEGALLDQNSMNMIETLRAFRESLVEILSNAIFEIKQILLNGSRSGEDFNTDGLNFLPALESLVLLFRIPSLLTNVEHGMIVQELIQITVKSPRNCVIHDQGLLALKNISIHRPSVFMHMILPSLMDELPESIVSDSILQVKATKEISSTLNDIIDVSCHPTLKEVDDGFPEGSISSHCHRNFDFFVTRLLKKIESLFLIKGQVFYCTLCTAAIFKGLKVFDQELESKKITDNAPDPQTSPYELLWNQIVSKSLQLTNYPESHPLFCKKGQYLTIRLLQNEGDVLDENFLYLAGNIILLIARSKLTTIHNNIVFKFYKGRFFPEKGAIPTQVEKLPSWKAPCEPEFMDDLSVSLVSIYPLVGLQPIPDDDRYLTKTKHYLGINENVGNFAVSTIKKILDPEKVISSRVRVSLLHFLQILVAKFYCSRDELIGGGRLIDFLTSLVKKAPNKTFDYMQNLYQTIVYVAAASFACLDRNLMEPILGFLSEALDPENFDPKICTLVAQSFRMILAESHILNKKNYVQVRSLRKGIALQLIMPLFIKYRLHSRIVGERIANHEKAKENHLIAIIGILRNIEDSLVLDQINFEELVTLALDGTNVPSDDWAKAEYIKLVRMLVMKRPDRMRGHVDSVIERMIERTHNTLEKPSDANVECRILALGVLRLMIENFGSSLLLSRRAKLISELAIAKDDCHAGVRQAAVQCSLALVYLGP